MADKKQQLEKCAHLLSKKSTDDEKLAGLLLVPKIVDIQDAESLGFLLDSMDSQFIERLLRTGIKQAISTTSTEAENISDNRPNSIPPMLSVALLVIDVFASHSSFAQQLSIVNRTRTLCAVAALDIESVADDAIQVLCKIFAEDVAVEMLLEQPDILFGVVDAAKTLKSGSLARTQFIDYVLSRCSQALHLQIQNVRFAAGWVSLLTYVSAVFLEAESIVKFELIPALASALMPIDFEDAVAINDIAACVSIINNIRLGCVWILRQKAEATKYCDQALVLCSHLVRLWPDLMFSSAGSKAEAKDDNDYHAQQEQHKATKLIIRLACVEGQNAIDSMMISVPTDKDIQFSGINVVDSARLQLGWKLPFCTEIAARWLEWTEEWLNMQGDDLADVDEEAIYSLMSDVSKLSEAAIGFLVDWKERTNSDLAMLTANAEMVVSTVHLLGTWLSTDSKLHKLAPPVLEMCTSWITQSDQYGPSIREYMRPSISFALDTCEVSEAQYVDDLKTHQLHHAPKMTQQFASSWVGTIEFDDLARAVYGIPSDEEMLEQSRNCEHI
ncbi:hypothetical protein GGI25_000509 [Coemansia spiralis]|uniref:Uncharacterized protein n=2 Tax=Coemansia TaxID=4863 RepID=A0A9W8GEF7_9FUNG|nr:hypothetical protein EDC05_000337 [Coemansia umbellata]KAJ2625413.1 hypothetical protein GGI26_000553 [Coemansia sp. RSA 1358]KAJ2680536.1 hypothetical protein GGI25_000509 [Coemansia spiralis]